MPTGPREESGKLDSGNDDNGEAARLSDDSGSEDTGRLDNGSDDNGRLDSGKLESGTPLNDASINVTSDSGRAPQMSGMYGARMAHQSASAASDDNGVSPSTKLDSGRLDSGVPCTFSAASVRLGSIGGASSNNSSFAAVSLTTSANVRLTRGTSPSEDPAASKTAAHPPSMSMLTSGMRPRTEFGSVANEESGKLDSGNDDNGDASTSVDPRLAAAIEVSSSAASSNTSGLKSLTAMPAGATGTVAPVVRSSVKFSVELSGPTGAADAVYA